MIKFKFFFFSFWYFEQIADGAAPEQCLLKGLSYQNWSGKLVSLIINTSQLVNH